jgi:hypothetical protein
MCSDRFGTLERGWRCVELDTQSVSDSMRSGSAAADLLVLQKCSTKRPELEAKSNWRWWIGRFWRGSKAWESHPWSRSYESLIAAMVCWVKTAPVAVAGAVATETTESRNASASYAQQVLATHDRGSAEPRSSMTAQTCALRPNTEHVLLRNKQGTMCMLFCMFCAWCDDCSA